MVRDAGGSSDEDWIFAVDDPSTLPTERLPDREEFDRYAAPLLPRSENETVDLSEVDVSAGVTADAPLEPPPITAPLRVPTYARSGITPNAEDDDLPPGGFEMPERFRDLGIFDGLRDVIALICLVAALTMSFTDDQLPWLDGVAMAGVATALIALVVVHLLRWIPASPPLGLIRVVRVAGLLPALLAALGALLADLVLALPVLFAPLPEGPPMRIGAGVALMLLGATVGIEPRAHEGFVPGAAARRRARTGLMVIAGVALAGLLLALVMIIGRIPATGWQYSLMTFANTMVSALLLGFVLSAALRRVPSWYVFSTGMTGALVIGALADNTLRLQFAAPLSVATGYVYLPLLFAAFGVMISRAFVRSMPISFRRADWLVHSVRAVEFSVVMHSAAVLWHLLAVVAGRSAHTPGGPVLHVMDAVVCACFVAVSLFARNALINRPATLARASGVVAAVVLVIVGFLAVIVNSVAAGTGAGLMTGGVALFLGIGVALMLTVPAPVRDEFGAPDLAQMFTDFRTRDAGRSSLLDRVPDVSAERSRKKSFPA